MSEQEEDFGAMFEASLAVKPVRKGQTVEGRIVGIGTEVAFVDVGGKGEAVVAIEELRDAEGVLEVAVGDCIHAVVVSTEGGLTLSRRLARGAATRTQLTGAFQARLPVEGKVERVVKGGYELRLGGQRAFCPFSQIDITRTADPEVHVGRVYSFRITELSEDGRNIVVSRRALLEEAQEAKAAEVRASIVPGAVLSGRVVSVRDYGAFVDLGGDVQGLLHVSDMAWSRVTSASESFAPGDVITVKVLRVDEQTQKIALGTKQLTDDPWVNVATAYEVGQVKSGRVTRVADFGAFVEIEAGVEVLAHVSTFSPTGRPNGWKELVRPGTTGEFEILSVDPVKRRIGVALVGSRPSVAVAAAADGSTPQGIAPGARVTGKVERHEKFGVFVFLAPGRTALMPLAETGVAREGDVVTTFPVGSEVDVIVLEADQSGRRIRVSRKAAIDAQEAEVVREYAERATAEAKGGMGTLADKLRGALSSRAK